MLLLLSKQIFCQSTVTKNIEIPVQQVTELYKGLKQNEYLKTRLQTTENTLKSADKFILEQEKSIESAKSIIVAKDDKATDELAGKQEQSQLYLKMFKKLSERCKEIITLALSDEHQEKIASQLGVTYGYLRKKKSECVSSLVQMIKSEMAKNHE